MTYSSSATANIAKRPAANHTQRDGGCPLRGGTLSTITTRRVAWRGTAAKFPKCLLFRKSQAAMEFLMTYGWAILVVLAAIVALAYFGVLSPSRFLPESCTLPSTSGLACLDFTLSPSAAHLFLVNGGGRDLVVNNITIGTCSASFTNPFADGTSYLFNLTGCSFGSAGEKVKKPLVVSYTDVSSGFSKEAAGSITASLS